MFVTPNTFANDRITTGIGLSALHHGLGINIGQQHDDTLAFVAIGCPALGYGGSAGWIYSCGAGAGFFKARVFNDSNKHTLGVHVGVSKVRYKVHDIYGYAFRIGAGYQYFFSEIDKPGWNIGFAPTIERLNNRNDVLYFLGGGYQF